jgi:hypothetical protein
MQWPFKNQTMNTQPPSKKEVDNTKKSNFSFFSLPGLEKKIPQK